MIGSQQSIPGIGGVMVGELIVDLFAGSGTTGVAAMLEGRTFIGCEMSNDYIEVARRRCAEAATQGTQDTIAGVA